MATDVGSIYLEVFADTKALKAQVRKAAKDAGKSFGKEWGDEVEKSMAPALSRIGRLASREMDDNGRLSAKSFGKAFEDEIRAIESDFDFDIARAFARGDWTPVFEQFDSLDEALRAVDTRISDLDKSNGQLARGMTASGRTAGELKDQMNASAEAIRQQGKANEEAAAEAERQKKATDEEAEAQKKANAERVAAKKAYADLTAEMKKSLAKQSARDTQLLRNEHENLNIALRDSTSQMRAFNKVDAGSEQGKQIQALNKEYDALSTKLRTTLQTHKAMTAGMGDDQKGVIEQVAKTRAEFAVLEAALKDLDKQRVDIKVDLDTPAKAKVAKEGFTLGKIFGKAFGKGSSSGGSKDIGSIFDFATKKWKEFAIAMPAGLQFILANLLLVIGPLSTIGSAIGSVLIPLVGALGVGIVGLGAAVAGFGAAAGYAVALAVKSFDVFEKKFPATQKAIDSLKDSFENVDVPRFAAEWSESLKRFAQTLADSLRFDQVAEMLGKATAAITDSFSDVLDSPAWTGFVDAIDGVTEGIAGPLANALQGIGTGLAGVFGVALQWMTAAAPLAQHLGEQFAIWGTNLNAALATTGGQEKLTSFMNVATVAIDSLITLVGNLGAGLGAVFRQGADEGTTMLGVLAGLAQQFNAWTQSAQGQEALNQLFSQGLTVFEALIPLVGAIGTALSTMVTPASVQSLIIFMNALTMIVPIFAEFIAAAQNLGAFDLLASLLQVVFTAIQPLIPVVAELAGLIGAQLSLVISSLGPVLVQLVSALAPVAVTFGELIKVLGPAISQVFAALGPVFAALGPVISAVLQAIMPLIPIFVQLITIVANLVSAILPPLMPVLAAVGELFTALGPVIAEIGGKIADVLVAAVTALAPLLIQLVPVILALVEAFMPIIDVVLDLAMTLINTLVPIIASLLPLIIALAPTLVQLFIAFNPVLRVVTLLAPILKLLAPLLMVLITVFVGLITPVLDLIEPILTFAVQLFAGKQAIEQIQKAITKFLPTIVAFASKFAEVFKKVGEAIGKFAEFIPGIFGNIVAGIGKFITAIGAIGGQIITGLFNGLAGMAGKVIGWISTFVTSIIDLFKSLFGIHSPSSVFLEFGTMILQGLIDGLVSMLSAIGTFFINLFATMGQMVITGITAYITFWLELPGKVIEAVSSLITLAGEWIGNVWASIVDIGTSAWNAYVSFWTDLPATIIGFVSPLIEKAGEWIGDVWGKIVEIATTWWNNEVAFWTGLPDKIIGFVTPLISKIGKFFTDVWNGAKNAVTTVGQTVLDYFRNYPQNALDNIQRMISMFTEFGTNVMNGLKSGFENGWNAVSSWVSGIADKIKGLAGDGLSVLKQAGINIITGFLNGLKQKWEDVKSFVGGLGSWIADHKGPRSVDIALLQPAGGWIMDGLQKGIKDSLPDLKRTLGGVTNAINVGGSASLGINANRAASNPVGPGGGGTTVASGAIQIVTPVRDPAIVAHMVLDGLVARAQ